MKNGLSIIIRNEEQFEKASKFIGEQYCYVKWVPQMAERETALVVWAKKKVSRSTGSVGCAYMEYSVDELIKMGWVQLV